MAITDELRDYARGCAGGMGGDALRHIADRIDAEHERAMADAELATAPTEAQMAELGYIALPLDADGVPIRPGDELVIFDTGEHIRTYDIELYDDGRWLVCDDETMDSIHPDRLRHRTPTVEDVLREFADRYLDYEGIPSAGRRGVGEAIMDEYAARLRLAEEVDA